MSWFGTFLWIIKKHKGQKDKSGKPYFLHPLNVSIHCRGHDAKIAGLLHDVLEDTKTGVRELIEKGFSDEVVKAVVLLSKPKNENYQEYILRVKENPIASEVKRNDLRHNMQLQRLKYIGAKDLKRYRKYKKALEVLKE